MLNFIIKGDLVGFKQRLGSNCIKRYNKVRKIINWCIQYDQQEMLYHLLQNNTLSTDSEMLFCEYIRSKNIPVIEAFIKLKLHIRIPYIITIAIETRDLNIVKLLHTNGYNSAPLSYSGWFLTQYLLEYLDILKYVKEDMGITFTGSGKPYFASTIEYDLFKKHKPVIEYLIDTGVELDVKEICRRINKYDRADFASFLIKKKLAKLSDFSDIVGKTVVASDIIYRYRKRKLMVKKLLRMVDYFYSMKYQK